MTEQNDLTLVQAATEVRKLLRGMRGIEMVANALDLVGSLEQEEQALTASINQLKVDLDTLAQQKTTALAENDAIVDNARTQAAALMNEASVGAADRLAAADAEASARVDAANATYADIQGQIFGAQAQLEGLQQQVAEAQGTLDNINEKTAAAKKKLAEFVGG